MKKISLANGNVVGVVEGGAFCKTLSSGKHFLRTPPAIALDVSTLHDAEQAGATRVVITDKDTANKYSADITRIRAKGFAIDRGFGLQIALPLKDWHISKPEQPELLEL